MEGSYSGDLNSFKSVNDICRIVRNSKKQPHPQECRKDTSYGSRWESPDVIKRDFKAVPFKEHVEIDVGGSPLFYDGDTAYIPSDEAHTLIVGATGSRKTRCVIAPTIKLLAKAGESIVVTDPKGELLDFSFTDLKTYGYDIHVLDFRSMSGNTCWNPLAIPYHLMKSGDKSMENEGRLMLLRLVSDMIPLVANIDPYWVTSAQGLLFGMMVLVIKKARNVSEATIYNVVMNVDRIFLSERTMEAFVNVLDKGSPEYVPIMAVINNATNTRRCILSTFNQAMTLYTGDNNIIDMLSKNTVELDTLGMKKSALFLVLPDENPSTYPLVTMFISQLYGALIKKAQSMESIKKLPVRVNYVLDEFAALPRVNAMPNMITAARGRNIRFILAIQDMAQLTLRYREDSKTIASNCANWVYLYCRQMEFLKELSDIVGNDDNGKPLITANGLMNLDVGEALIICGRMRPFRSKLRDISEYPGSDDHYPIEERASKCPREMNLLTRCKVTVNPFEDFEF